MSDKTIPQSCPHGLTDDDLRELLGDRYPHFRSWMRVSTVGRLCSGWRRNRATWAWEPSECSGTPHGIVIRQAEVCMFLNAPSGVMDWWQA